MRSGLLALGVLALVGFAPQGDFKVYRNYKVGEKDSYSVSTTIHAGPATIESTGTMIWEVVKVYDNGDADLKQTMENFSTKFNDRVMSQNLPSLTFRVTPQGFRVGKDEGRQGMNPSGQLMKFAALAGNSGLKIGQEVPIDVTNEETHESVKGTATLESIADGLAKVVAAMDVKTEKLTEPMHVDVTTWFNTADSKTAKIEGKITNVVMGQQGTGSIDFKLERKSE